jgi:hypothetical protein
VESERAVSAFNARLAHKLLNAIVSMFELQFILYLVLVLFTSCLI